MFCKISVIELKVSRTICTATELRQQAALDLASKVRCNDCGWGQK